MNGFWTSFVTVLTAIVGVAIVATLVSRNSQTPQVIGSFWDGFSGSLRAATGPVTGGSSGMGNLSSLTLPTFGTNANV